MVEYSPKYVTNSNETLKINSDAYVKHIQTASINVSILKKTLTLIKREFHIKKLIYCNLIHMHTYTHKIYL